MMGSTSTFQHHNVPEPSPSSPTYTTITNNNITTNTIIMMMMMMIIT